MDSSVGRRIAQERKRLGLNQDDFADIGGVKRAAQVNYEGGRRAPDADYLIRIGEYGVDINFVLFGADNSSDLIVDEKSAENKNNPLNTMDNGEVGTASETRNTVPTSMVQVEPSELQWLAWYKMIPDDEKPMVEAVVKRFADNAVEEEDQEGEVG
ncbi:MAG: helix-turn-helix transcriptional regulator [Candidatus Sedimenticola sp. (ex Thyasira tokunagai)]